MRTLNSLNRNRHSLRLTSSQIKRLNLAQLSLNSLLQRSLRRIILSHGHLIDNLDIKQIHRTRVSDLIRDLHILTRLHRHSLSRRISILTIDQLLQSQLRRHRWHAGIVVVIAISVPIHSDLVIQPLGRTVRTICLTFLSRCPTCGAGRCSTFNMHGVNHRLPFIQGSTRNHKRLIVSVFRYGFATFVRDLDCRNAKPLGQRQLIRDVLEAAISSAIVRHRYRVIDRKLAAVHYNRCFRLRFLLHTEQRNLNLDTGIVILLAVGIIAVL